MRRRELIILGAGAAIAWPLAIRAQPKGLPVIGFLGSNLLSRVMLPWLAEFHRGLSETGYVEGQNVAIEYRWAERHIDRLPTLAADLVARKVDAIVTEGGDASSLAAKKPAIASSLRMYKRQIFSPFCHRLAFYRSPRIA